MGTVTVAALGKAYKQYPSQRTRLKEWLLPWSKPCHSLKWILKDISFIVQPGEAVGVIGVNGAGKSTLLKLLTGTTQPTLGSVKLEGRVAAMLELGMGFHPDFTGRQNVYMAGQLLGYGMGELEGLMPEIEAFAEIGEYIDQPVRIYSSGMQMRLAFSVATARRPDILVVDEALAVGDAYFQHKSFDRIREYRRKGTTLLIVSHDKVAIQSICDRAILLDAGRLAMEGHPEAVMDYYNAMLADRENKSVRQMGTQDGKVQTISGSGEATVIDIAMIDAHDQRVEVVKVGEAVCLRIVVEVRADLPELVLGYMIKDRLGQPVFGTNSHHLKRSLASVPKGARIEFQFRFLVGLGVGAYSVAVALHTSDNHIAHNYEWRDLAFMFNVINIDQSPFVGLAWLPPVMECKLNER